VISSNKTDRLTSGQSDRVVDRQIKWSLTLLDKSYINALWRQTPLTKYDRKKELSSFLQSLFVSLT